MLYATNIIFLYYAIYHIPLIYLPLPFIVSTQPTSFIVGLVSALLLLSRLGMIGVGWVPLTPACTPFSTVASVLSYATAGVASSPVTLDVTVILSISIALLAALSVNSVSGLLGVITGLSPSRSSKFGCRRFLASAFGVPYHNPPCSVQ